jgi:hypothetical protein
MQQITDKKDLINGAFYWTIDKEDKVFKVLYPVKDYDVNHADESFEISDFDCYLIFGPLEIPKDFENICKDFFEEKAKKDKEQSKKDLQRQRLLLINKIIEIQNNNEKLVSAVAQLEEKVKELPKALISAQSQYRIGKKALDDDAARIMKLEDELEKIEMELGSAKTVILSDNRIFVLENGEEK